MYLFRLVLLCVISLQASAQKVLFAGNDYQIKFSEGKVDPDQSNDETNDIRAFINGEEQNKTPLNGDWYIETGTDESNNFLILKNSNVSKTPTSFNLVVRYRTKEITNTTYYILNVDITDSFTIPSNPDAESFTLQCMYGENPDFSLKELFWGVQTESGYNLGKDYVKSGAYNVYEGREVNTIKFTVAKSDSKLMYKRKESLTAYSGIYGCHVVVTKKTGSVHPVRATKNVTVYAMPRVEVYQKRTQFLSGETVTIECVVDGYPLPNITWRFALRQKAALKTLAEAVGIGSDQEKHIIERDYTLVGENKFNARVASTLSVTDLDNKLDRGLYLCKAQNIFGMDESHYYLRIRYRLAYLIPLGGVVIQVIALVACITFYKMRAKDANPEKEVANKIKRQRLHPDQTDSGSKLDAPRPARRASNPHTDPLSLGETDQNTFKPAGSPLAADVITGYRPHELSGKIDEEKEFRNSQ